MEQLLSSMLGPIARGLRDTNAFGNSGDIYADTQYRGEPLTMPAPSGGGFAANYTPIRFAPLVSLTGPVMAPATPAAPEVAAPMIRPPMMAADQGGGYEAPQRTDAAFQNLQPIGNRSGAEIRGDLGRIGGFFMSPLATMASYAMTGKSPMELMSQGAQSPFGGFLQGFRGLFPGSGPEEVPLFETRAPIESRGPTTIVGGNGQYIATPDLVPIEQTNARFNDPAFYNAIVAGVPIDQMQQTNMAPILEALNQSILQGTSTMEQFGPQETGGGFAPSDFGGVGASAPEGSTAFGDASSGAYGYI